MPEGLSSRSSLSVLICGSRNWCAPRPIFAAVEALPPGSEVIVGGAKGADHLAEVYAKARGDLTVTVMPADWDRYGKRAGYLRNVAMLDRGPDRVLAFQREGSKGTQHTINIARERGIPVDVFSDDRPKPRPEDVVWIEDGDDHPWLS